MSQDNFDAAWRRYLNQDDGASPKPALKRCLDAAETVDQAIQVFNAVSGPGQSSDGMPTQALKRMIELAKTKEEMKKAYSFASIRDKGRKHRHHYPAMERAAREKLATF